MQYLFKGYEEYLYYPAPNLANSPARKSDKLVTQLTL